jgi:hypothetical protein
MARLFSVVGPRLIEGNLLSTEPTFGTVARLTGIRREVLRLGVELV